MANSSTQWLPSNRCSVLCFENIKYIDISPHHSLPIPIWPRSFPYSLAGQLRSERVNTERTLLYPPHPTHKSPPCIMNEPNTVDTEKHGRRNTVFEGQMNKLWGKGRDKVISWVTQWGVTDRRSTPPHFMINTSIDIFTSKSFILVQY